MPSARRQVQDPFKQAVPTFPAHGWNTHMQVHTQEQSRSYMHATTSSMSMQGMVSNVNNQDPRTASVGQGLNGLSSIDYVQPVSPYSFRNYPAAYIDLQRSMTVPPIYMQDSVPANPLPQPSHMFSPVAYGHSIHNLNQEHMSGVNWYHASPGLQSTPADIKSQNENLRYNSHSN